MRRVSNFTLICLGYVAASDAQPIPMDVEIAASHRLFKGLPNIVTLRVTNQLSADAIDVGGLENLSEAQKQATLTRLYVSRTAFPMFEVFGASAPVQLEIEGPSGEVTTHGALREDAFLKFDPNTVSPPVNPARARKPRVSLLPAESKTFIVDIGPLLQDLGDGQYNVRLLLFNDMGAVPWKSAPFQVEIESLSGTTLSLLERASPAAERKGIELDPDDWLVGTMDLDLLRAELPPEMFETLSLYAFLSSVIETRSVQDAPLELLSSLPSHLSQLAEVLKHEVLLARGDLVRASAIEEQIRTNNPELAWRIDRTLVGDGLLKTALDRFD